MSEKFFGISIKAKNYKCFGEVEAGFEQLKPINVVIGRNNSGKSALVDLLELCATRTRSFKQKYHDRAAGRFELLVGSVMSGERLLPMFPESNSGGSINGNHGNFARSLNGQNYVRSIGADQNIKLVGGLNLSGVQHDSRQLVGDQIANASQWPLDGYAMIRVAAERDVVPETRNSSLSVAGNGIGTTNLIRGFINQDTYPREQVEVELLRELNEIYLGDSEFDRISCREDENGSWEIFLTEQSKGEVRLSQSGSSLKSIFIILAYLRLEPIYKRTDWSSVIFAVEEPENNLHPALLRRLLEFLARQQQDKGFLLVLTTHSPVGIDWASRRTDTQIIHVRNTDGSATVVQSTKYLTNRDILDDLDIRASDMLQANGIIWVEGPSDRIYLRRWIELWTNGAIKEGVHYSMMFYGGKLLSHLEFKDPAETDRLISIMSLNRNAAIVIDSDRHQGRAGTAKAKPRKPRLNINATKSRIRDEVEAIGGLVWITQGREVENYIPNIVYERLGTGQLNAGIYDELPEHPYLAAFKADKVSLAHAVVGVIEKTDIQGMDLAPRLDQLVAAIKAWNKAV
jgi:putative ATP-dependent endonuclease of the OLD family